MSDTEDRRASSASPPAESAQESEAAAAAQSEGPADAAAPAEAEAPAEPASPVASKSVAIVSEGKDAGDWDSDDSEDGDSDDGEILEALGVDAASESSEGHRAAARALRRLRIKFFNPLADVNHKREVLIERLETKGKLFAGPLEQLSYCVGMINISATPLIAFGRYPEMLPAWYTSLFIIFIPWRFLSYSRNRNWGFLCDFCYFVNGALLAYLWIWPESPELFVMCFTLAHGPLAWAVVVFNNSLVVHSVDKLTSAFIHILPPLVVHCLRWYDRATSRFTHICVDHDPPFDPARDEEDCEAPLLWLYGAPLLFFIGQQFVYLLFILIMRKKLEQDKNYLTTYRYLSTTTLKPIFERLGLGRYARIAAFTSMYWVFVIATFFPAWIFWNYYWANLIFLLVVTLVALYNGSRFYSFAFAGVNVEKRRARKRQLAEAKARAAAAEAEADGSKV